MSSQQRQPATEASGNPKPHPDQAPVADGPQPAAGPGQAATPPLTFDPSAGQPGVASTQPGYGMRQTSVRLWRPKRDGVTTFRHSAPLVLWWAWVAFMLWNFYDIATSHLGIRSVRVVAALLLVSGIMYACTLHSRVECDDEGVTVYNPVQDHHVPWGGVEGIYLGDSVEFCCHRPAPQSDKTIYSWALYSRRRARARMRMQGTMFSASRRMVSERAPQEAADLARQQAAQLMAAELGKRARDSRAKGAAEGFLQSRWSWLPIATIAVPAVALVAAFLIR